MKYLVLETENQVLHSYLSRAFGGLRIGNVTYIPSDIDMPLGQFKSLCKYTSGSENKLIIKKARVPYLEKLSIVEYARLLFKK